MPKCWLRFNYVRVCVRVVAKNYLSLDDLSMVYIISVALPHLGWETVAQKG